MNTVVLIGRLTRDVELRYSQSSKAVGKFTLAVDRQGKDDEADFISVTTFGKTAENCSQYIGKGRLVAVSGRLQIRDYTDRDGNKRKAAEVIANTVQFLDKPKEQENRGDAYEGDDGGFGDLNDSEVPF